ncbi:hypothetical protein HNQ77_002255 [Silvibacterium bohemicum]|uniref:Uncharacterized protein n=1 Tax=Silvibacterium bohemicum TaxID=1577686 RepID=A0A841JSB9_9BACT|nr:hypothetical protein [Silvibacterium bohemicum]
MSTAASPPSKSADLGECMIAKALTDPIGNKKSLVERNDEPAHTKTRDPHESIVRHSEGPTIIVSFLRGVR